MIWLLVALALVCAGAAMVVADQRRRRVRAVERARAEHAAREARLAAEEVSLFEPPPKKTP